MHKRIWVLTVATFLGLASLTASATTPTYDNIYVFGDSYCDVGNIFVATGGAEPAAPYFNGRFSNGPIWLDHVAGFLGVPMKASLLGGTNYAFGGAWVTAPQSIPGGTIPSVPRTGSNVPRSAWRQSRPECPLHSGGRRERHSFKPHNRFAPGPWLPDCRGFGGQRIDATPGGRKALRHSQSPQRRAASSGGGQNCIRQPRPPTRSNNWVDKLLAYEQLLQGIHILRMEVFSLMDAIQKDPYHFGFDDDYDPCLTTTVCGDPGPYVLLGYTPSDRIRSCFLRGHSRKMFWRIKANRSIDASRMPKT